MRRFVSISVLLVQCAICQFQAEAATGHTVRNGGGKAEIAFREVWKNLGDTFAPCLAANGVCALTSAETEALRRALAQRECYPQVEFDPRLVSESFAGECGQPVKIHPAILYTAAGEPRPQVELTSIALNVLLRCQSELQELNTLGIAQAALQVVYFRELIIQADTPWQIYQKEGEAGARLFVQTPLGRTELTSLFKNKLKLDLSQPLRLWDVRASNRNSFVEVTGKLAQPHWLRSYQFSLLLPFGVNGALGEKPELVVF